MQETHLKKVEKTDILSTLKSFKVGDSEQILFADSGVDTDTFRTRCADLRRSGLLDGKYKFIRCDTDVRRGTLILRTA